MNKNGTVICRTAWPFAQGEPLVQGVAYTVVRAFWRNGEGWLTVRNAAGKQTTCPDIFFDEVKRQPATTTHIRKV